MRNEFSSRSRGGLAPHAGDIQQHVGLKFFLVEPVLHQVADADDPAELFPIDQREHGEFSLSVIVANTASIRSDERQLMIGALIKVADPKFKRRGAIRSHRVDEVTLGKHAGQVHPLVFHHDGADPIFRQTVHSIAHAVRKRPL